MHALARTHLSDLAADFIAYLGGDPRGHGTTRAYADDLRQFLALVGSRGVLRVGQVDRSVVYGYLAELRGKRYQPETIHRRLASLQSFFRYLMTERAWGANPTLRLRQPRRPDPVPRAYEWDAALAMLDEIPTGTALGVRDRCLLSLWLFTGLRIAETLALDWSDVSLTDHAIHVRRAKGGRERVVHFGERLASELDAWRVASWRSTDRDPVFVGRFGSRLDAKAVYAAVRRYGLYARHKLTPHRLRHTHATELLRRGGVSIRTLQVRLGHRDLRSTMTYTRVFDADEQRAAAVLG